MEISKFQQKKRETQMSCNCTIVFLFFLRLLCALVQLVIQKIRKGLSC